MPKNLVRYQKTGHLHFLTFSCYRRQQYFRSANGRELFERALETIQTGLLPAETVPLRTPRSQKRDLGHTPRRLNHEIWATRPLDAIGTLPEGGTVGAAFSGFYGAAGVSNGNKILGRAAFAGGLLSTASAGHDLQGPQESSFSTFVTGLQATAGGAGIAKGLIEDIPVAGQVFAAVSVGLDILGTGVDIYNCPK